MRRFGLDFVTAFVLVILLLAFDFWTVKVQHEHPRIFRAISLHRAGVGPHCRTYLGGYLLDSGGGLTSKTMGQMSGSLSLLRCVLYDEVPVAR
jgi:hypothetical protein